MKPKTWTTGNLWSALQRVLSADAVYSWIIDIKPIGQTVIYGDSGKYFEAPYTVDASGTVSIGTPVEVRSQTMYWPADQVSFNVFSSSRASSDGTVELTGLLWRAGRFPERPIRETDEKDVEAIVANFERDPEAAAVILDHNETSFLNEALERDGAKITKLWAQGKELWGTIRVPGWFASAAREMIKSVSVGLDETLQRLEEVSFVRHPRVADAAVFCTLPSFELFAQSHPEIAERIRQGQQATDNQRKDMSKNPSVITRLVGIFTKLPPDQREGLTEADITAALTPTPETTPTPSQEFQGDPALVARIAELERQTATQSAQFAHQTRMNNALTLYGAMLNAGKVVPAQRDGFIKEYIAASIADEHNKFDDKHAESFIAAMKAKYEAAPALFHFGAPRIDSHSEVEEARASIFSDSDWAATGSPDKGGK